MIVTCVFVSVKPEFIEAFKLATKINYENSVLEPGNLRFDILQQMEDNSKFTFYEAYLDMRAVSAHKNTSHYLDWKETVESYMAEPRRSIMHTVIYPDETSQW
jgi:(4S)-4-hydroxy-5-phosphonooxypentane-2,3-dione isomerase